MKQSDFEAFIMDLPNVQRQDNLGYAFFFVGDDRRLPFVTIVDSDNEYDNVSNLNREHIFRLNIGVSKETYHHRIAVQRDEGLDYSAVNEFLPHPQYSRQHFVCILNPVGEHAEIAKQLILEAHSIAARRLERKGGE